MKYVRIVVYNKSCQNLEITIYISLNIIFKIKLGKNNPRKNGSKRLDSGDTGHYVRSKYYPYITRYKFGTIFTSYFIIRIISLNYNKRA